MVATYPAKKKYPRLL